MKQTNLNPSTGPVDAFCLLVFDPEKVFIFNLKQFVILFPSLDFIAACLCLMDNVKVYVFEEQQLCNNHF